MHSLRSWAVRTLLGAAIAGTLGTALAADYDGSPQVAEFVEEMTRDYGFASEQLVSLFAEVETGEDGRAKLAVILNCVASGEPQPSPSVMLYHAARKLAAHDAYLEQDSRRLELESEEYDDAIFDDPVREDRRAMARELGW